MSEKGSLSNKKEVRVMGKIKVAALMVAVIVVSFSVVAAVFLAAVPAKNTQTLDISSNFADEVHIKVNQGGYFLEDGSHVTEALRLPRGHRVKIVFTYAYTADMVSAISPDESPVHQFTIRASDSAGQDTFRLQSKPLSAENPKVEMEFDVGRGGIDKYMMYCDINCNAMVQLFKEIVVIG